MNTTMAWVLVTLTNIYCWGVLNALVDAQIQVEDNLNLSVKSRLLYNPFLSASVCLSTGDSVAIFSIEERLVPSWKEAQVKKLGLDKGGFVQWGPELAEVLQDGELEIVYWDFNIISSIGISLLEINEEELEEEIERFFLEKETFNFCSSSLYIVRPKNKIPANVWQKRTARVRSVIKALKKKGEWPKDGGSRTIKVFAPTC